MIKHMHFTDTNTFPKLSKISLNSSINKMKSWYSCKSQEVPAIKLKIMMSTLLNSIKKLKLTGLILNSLICSLRMSKPEILPNLDNLRCHWRLDWQKKVRTPLRRLCLLRSLKTSKKTKKSPNKKRSGLLCSHYALSNCQKKTTNSCYQNLSTHKTSGLSRTSSLWASVTTNPSAKAQKPSPKTNKQ